MIYNAIREIESTFRVLKTDLDLCPIYHKKDQSSMSHLHLGLLAYWIVNSIRYQLKQSGIHDDWKEIRRKAQTQKPVLTTAQNSYDKIMQIKGVLNQQTTFGKSMKPLGTRNPKPYKQIKFVVHKPPLKKVNHPTVLSLSPISCNVR